LNRRLKFSIVVIISQTLLIALAISWFIHMLLIEIYGAVYFVEKEPAILWAEIITTVMIVLFGGFVLIVQIKRLGEKRANERRTEFTDNERPDTKLEITSQQE
jgi:ABC-type nickel/cobalt efflux system permease component RcnA